MTRVLVCGDRHWTDAGFLRAHLDKIKIDVLIQGDCTEADRLAKAYAKDKNIPCLSFPAQWEKYKAAAGPIRNALMLKEGKPDLVIVFHDNVEKSKGSKNMKAQAEKAGLPVMVISHNGN